MDALDRKIVSLLLQNGRMPHEQVSKEVGLSRPAVHDRIRRLEQEGVIAGYGARVNWEKLGLPVTAFINVRTAGNCSETAKRIYELSTPLALVENCTRVAGDWCLHVQTRSSSTLTLQDLLDSVRALPGVQATGTTISLSSVAPDISPAQLISRSTK